jgi:hypothetical protein
MNNSVEALPSIKLSTAIDHSEVNDDLFIVGYNSLLANSDSKAARDFYLLLMVYVNYFCIPIFSFALKSLNALRESVRCAYSEVVRVTDMPITFFMVDKEYITMIPFSRTKQAECNSLSGNVNRKTVLL